MANVDKGEGGEGPLMWRFFLNLNFKFSKIVEMWIRVERGWGSNNVNKDFFVVFLGFLKGSFGLFNSYLVVFGLFIPKTIENK